MHDDENNNAQPRYINTVNGVYDTGLRRNVYGHPSVAAAPLPSGEELPVWARAKVQGGSLPKVVDTEGGGPNGQLAIAADALAGRPRPELPTWYLPQEIRDLSATLSVVLDCSEDVVISTMFAVVSGAVGTQVRTFDGKYENMLNINVCHVGLSGSNKSTPARKLVKLLDDISQKMDREYREEKRRCLERKDTANIPRPQILYVSGSTPEGIYKMLAYNPRGLFVRRDELAAFIDDLAGRYSNGGGGISDFLSIFTNETVSIIRAGEDPLVIPNPYLTVVGGLQPDILPDILGKRQLIYNGFNFRWLFVVPEMSITLERSTLRMPQAGIDYWNRLIARFLGIGPTNMTFDDGAQRKLDDYFRETRMKKLQGGDTYMDGVRDKLFIYLEKWSALATLVHYSDAADFGSPRQSVITAEAVEYSIECMHVFEHWAEKVRDMLPLHGGKRQMTLGEAIRTINSVHHIKNKSMFAESCGMTREQLYKYLQKADKPGSGSEVTPQNAGNADGQGG